MVIKIHEKIQYLLPPLQWATCERKSHSGVSFFAPSLSDKRTFSKERRATSEVQCQWHSSLVWVHRPQFNIHKDKLNLTDTSCPNPRNQHPFLPNSHRQCLYIPPVSSKYICLLSMYTERNLRLSRFLGISHVIQHSQVKGLWGKIFNYS